MRILFLVFLTVTFFHGFSQAIDVQHYSFRLLLSDDNDKVNGRAIVVVSFPDATTHFSLDLVQVKNNGKGMKVENVKGRNVNEFKQTNDRVVIQLKNAATAKSTDTFEIVYSGIPADGLIISKNKFGDRTFFSDNWPDRARNWIPCNDVPNDKASVEFTITAPAYYQVISNGVQIEETNIDKTTKLTHWKEETPIPTKIMVIGVAQFAVSRTDNNYSVPVTAWVYPQNKEKGVYDYSLATGILSFFTEYIGPYPFQKLANVQSTTIFGGMENASAIFYDESTVDGKQTMEHTISHEIIHQWFGDMATEKSFAHLWLSEGFATYLTDVYWEHKYGKEKANERLEEEREKIIKFSRINNHPVVDSVSDFMSLLNANSYQKGAWVLHMLRGEVGDAVFQKIIREYYQQYKGSNADTRDFQRVAEKVSGRKLDLFFNQWLYQPGMPKINAQWKMQGNQLAITIQQTGKNAFQFPLTIGYYLVDGKMQTKKIRITKATETFLLPINSKPAKLVLDPLVELLFEGNISEAK
jgi:aminopeptidase N